MTVLLSAEIFSSRELLLPTVYKPGNLVLWGPQLYFVIFGNRLRLIALLFFPLFCDPSGALPYKALDCVGSAHRHELGGSVGDRPRKSNRHV